MVRFGPILLLILLSACSTTGSPGPSDGGSPETQRPRDLRVERVASGAPGGGAREPRGARGAPPGTRGPGQRGGGRGASRARGEGPREPRVVLAPSAEALSRDLGAQIRGSGEGTYPVVAGGQQPTGGYSVGVAGARVEGGRVTVRVSLEDPPPDAIVRQSPPNPNEIPGLRGRSAGGKGCA